MKIAPVQPVLHLWYRVKFDEDTDLKEAAARLSKLGEINKIQANSHIKRAYDSRRYRSYINEDALRRVATRSALTMSSSFF